ncbi:hypothetical protein UDX32_16435 [Serratia marcescens]|uniref:hypothetical protein n=1 Tax=Serratia marcescens TaxID=615 RepID=UPI001184D24A|nr:hypothetical protein [Serratia marcescens]CAI2092345.1 Uncharacterised protein [Serratia marcescens]HAT2880931.1 hypothetical protein [Serratia marcescens]HAT2892222.1 hypothetical protein [Serratia marcescens]HAT2896825.1 hypothetical protein [Serratia marcescens]HAT2903655.1 hypothetical protein [Serratia marcescens]
MDVWSDMERELKRYQDSVNLIKQYVIKYNSRCEELIAEIARLTYEESQLKFDEIYNIQEKLAIALYKYEFHLDEHTRDLVYHFERDDKYSRLFWYEKFKNGLSWPAE